MGTFFRKNGSNFFVSVCFLVFLTVAAAVTAGREKLDYSYYENRALASRPEYTAQADGDGSYVNQWERYLTDHAALRNTLLRVKTQADLALHRPVVNEVVPRDGILLPYLPAVQAQESTVAAQAAEMADNLQRIQSAATGYGGYYCYVHVPCQYAYYPDRYPDYLENNETLSRWSVEYLSRALEERDVPFLDVAAAFREMGEPDEYASRVDNHYSMQGAFAAYQLVLEKINADTGLEIPILREEDVTFEALPNPYLGSRERKLLSCVRLNEPLYVLRPNQEIPFTRVNSGGEEAAAVYAIPPEPWQEITYNLYMGGDMARTHIDTGREDLPSILIYGDSFTNAMECVLYLSFDEMYSLDLRHYHEKPITDFIREVQPDVVICVRDTENLLTLWDNGGAF